MFTYTWNPLSLSLALLVSGLFALKVSHLLHLRYDRQFGAGFLLTGLVALAPPALASIGVSVYLIAESGLSLLDRSLMLSLLLVCLLWVLWRLKHRLLKKIFAKQSPQSQPNEAATITQPSDSAGIESRE